MKHIKVIIFVQLFSAVNILFAQDIYTLEWSKTESSQIISYTEDCPDALSHECQKVRLDSEKNIIVAGSSLENGSFDFLIVKYSNNGDLLWKHLLNPATGSVDYLTGILIDDEDNIIVIGHSIQSNDIAKSIIIKISAVGDIIWQSTYSNDYEWSFPRDLTLDDNGDIYLKGYINKDYYNGEIFVAKFDKHGTFIWDNIYSDDENGTYKGLKIRIVNEQIQSLGYFQGSSPFDARMVFLKHDKNGNLIQSNETSYLGQGGGLTSYFIDAQGNSYIGLFGTFKILKYNSDGSQQWTFTVPNNLPSNVIAEEVEDIISDSNGNVYITGRHYGENYGNTSLYTNGDLQVVKISPEGNLIYDYNYQNLGTNAFDGGNKLFLGKDDCLVVGGQSQKNYISDYDYVAIVLNEFGKAIDTLRYSEQGDEVIKSVIMDDNLNFYVTGTGNGNTLTQKYFFQGVLDVKEDYWVKDNISVYPNPFNEYINIGLNEKYNNIDFRVFNSSGSIVGEFLNIVSGIRIDTHALLKGTYYYQIITENYTHFGKLLK
ncbi:MAG: T9SS type A sorting domain-containing protein [Thermodesulfovibrionia bacterium]|nr:T9SS type A sorting domain-containing protein [Thermodesulfovibrionia bacterium]